MHMMSTSTSLKPEARDMNVQYYLQNSNPYRGWNGSSETYGIKRLEEGLNKFGNSFSLSVRLTHYSLQ